MHGHAVFLRVLMETVTNSNNFTKRLWLCEVAGQGVSWGYMVMREEGEGSVSHTGYVIWDGAVKFTDEGSFSF